MKKGMVNIMFCMLIGILFLVPTNIVRSERGAPSESLSRFLCKSCIKGVDDELSLEPQILAHENSAMNEVFAELNSITEEQFMGLAPPIWDWRNVDGQDWTTPIKNQLQDVCGSCWAFGSLAALESAIKIWGNNAEWDIDLSEQYMLSCSQGSCEGWYWLNTLNWIKKNGAIPEPCFPYEADDTISCDAKCSEWNEMLIGIENYHRVSSDVTSIQNALIEYGPLATTMYVYEDFYPDYPGGVYRYTYGELVFGHIVTIVGYNDTWGEEDEGYWIVKNSWGTEWGEEGWFRIAYGECEIEKETYYFTGPNYCVSKPEKPIGTTTGKVGEIYRYSATAIDPDGDKIRFYFDWGDGTETWTNYVNSGETASINYTWEKTGMYTVRVKVQDEHWLESDWSDPLLVSMPLIHQRPLLTLIERLLDWLERIFEIEILPGIFNI